MSKAKVKATPAKPIVIAAQPLPMHKRDLSLAANLIKQFEGYRAKAYLDSVKVPTIGWGSTKGVKMGMVITPAQGDALFQADFLEHMVPVQRALKVEVNDNEFGSMVSLCYNIGAGGFTKSSLLRKLNAGVPRTEVAAEFMKWNKAGGRVLPGLTRRRKLEQALFLTPVKLQTLS